MSVHYKFKSALDYDTVTFDGLHISVGDLKAAISQQKRIGKTSDFDLQITNAQTKEVYVDDNTLIPKNTSLLVARVPLAQQPKKHWEGLNSNQSALIKDVAPNKGLADLSRMEGSEQDKINAMISQSTFDYDPSNYQKIRGQNQRGIVPSNYVCYKCQVRGHWIKDCPTVTSAEVAEVKRSTGIPRSLMVPVEDPKAPGAMMTPSGTFAVPAVDHEAYLASENAATEDPPPAVPAAPEPSVPDELICSLCRDLLTDAVMIPCCGNSFCDECIRGALLESEDHECPDCREKEIAPTTLIPNRFLRNSVSSFRNQTGYNRRMPHRPSNPPRQAHPPVVELPQAPPNGPAQPKPNNASGLSRAEDSDGSADDNITVTVPPAHTHQPPPLGPPPAHGPPSAHGPPPARHGPGGPHPLPVRVQRPQRYGGHPMKSGMEGHRNLPRMDEQRASTPTIDERRDPLAQGFNRPPASFRPGLHPPGQPPPRQPPPGQPPFPNAPPFRHGPPPGARPPFERFPPAPEPYQPPPPGIKDSPTNGTGDDDPLEAFNRMIREKEMRAKRREEERRRGRSGSRSISSRSRSRSPPPRSPPRSRSPVLRSPRSPARSPPPRSPPRPRPRSPRYTRSRSISRGRVMRGRSPWSPRRRRSRERSLSLTRSPSPRRRHRSPLRYRSPMRPAGLRTPLRSPIRSPLRSPLLRSPLLRTPPRSPLRSPHRGPRSPPPRPLSPHRFTGVYDELLSPPRRSVEPPYGPRYGPRNNGPPPAYPPLQGKPIPLASVPIQNEPPIGYRGRYDGPPIYDDIPPGVEPAVPGFEPSPFEKPSFNLPGLMDRERLPPSNFRDPYRAPFVEPGPPGPGYREPGPIPTIPNDIPVHVPDQGRYRDNFRPGPPFRDQGHPPFRDGQPYRDPGPQPPYREGPPGPPREFRGPPGTFRENSYRGPPFRDGNFRENPPHNFREGGPPFRPPSIDHREPVPPNYDPNYRDGYRDEPRDTRGGRYPGASRSRGGPRRPPTEQDRHRERDPRERERHENRDPAERVERVRDDKRHEKGRDPRDDRERAREYERGRDYEKDKERDYDRISPDKKLRASPKRSRDGRERRGSESKASRSRDRDRVSKRDRKEERMSDKSSERTKDHKEKEKKEKSKENKKKKKKEKDKEKEPEKKKKREKKEKKDKDAIKKEGEPEDEAEKSDSKEDDKPSEVTEPEEKPVTVKIEKPDPDEQPELKPEVQPEVAPEVKKEISPVPESDEKPPPTDDLYGDEPSEAIDKEIMQNYVKAEEPELENDVKNVDNSAKEEPFDGLELQATADDMLELKADESAVPSKEMLAPLPELSKWEVDEENADKTKEPGEITSPDEDEDSGKVTSEVLKRAENAIFAKAISSLRPIEIKKINSERAKLYSGETPQTKSSIQITVPASEPEARSIEFNDSKKKRSKTPPQKLSVKERLGGKVEIVRGSRDARVVHSTVERVKSRSKTPKKDQQPYRRVTVDKDLNRRNDFKVLQVQSKGDRRIVSDKNYERKRELEKKKETKDRTKTADRERKKSTLDESHFEPDYDETVESENEAKNAPKKRDASRPPTSGASDPKKPKIDESKSKKSDSDSDSSSSEDSSSSSSSDGRKKKRKKKRSKKKRKRAASDSDSDSDTSSDDYKKKKKRRKHKKKSSKKKKKSKHK